MKIKILSNFHVFAPKDGRDKRVAFTAGTTIDAGDLPEGHSARDWAEKGLAEEVGGAAVAVEANDAV